MGYYDLNITTPLYADMCICTEFLHCTHEEFTKLSRLEKTKLRLFGIVKGKKFEEELNRKKLERASENKDQEFGVMEHGGRKTTR